MRLLDILDVTDEDWAWLQPELYRRAAMHYEQADMWSEAAACWVEAGETGRAGELYRALDNHARAAPLLLAQGRYTEALESYRAWLARLRPGDEVGEVTARLGVVACLNLVAEAGESLAERQQWQREAQQEYRQARALVEDEAEREPLMAGRCWEALAAYGATVGRDDLVQVGYELALARYGARYNRERVRTTRAYLEAVKGNRLLTAELEKRLAEWNPDLSADRMSDVERRPAGEVPT